MRPILSRNALISSVRLSPDRLKGEVARATKGFEDVELVC